MALFMASALQNFLYEQLLLLDTFFDPSTLFSLQILHSFRFIFIST